MILLEILYKCHILLSINNPRCYIYYALKSTCTTLAYEHYEHIKNAKHAVL